jgi:hypothetical protein
LSDYLGYFGSLLNSGFKLNHNLKELNALGNSYAHSLELEKKQISFYSSMKDGQVELEKSSITESNFENHLIWLCDTTIVELANA